MFQDQLEPIVQVSRRPLPEPEAPTIALTKVRPGSLVREKSKSQRPTMQRIEDGLISGQSSHYFAKYVFSEGRKKQDQAGASHPTSVKPNL